MIPTETRSEIEAWVVEVCRDLGLPIKNAADDFFESGGSSLTALKLIARAEERFGEDALDPEDLFANSSLVEIAASIKVADRGAAPQTEK